MAARLASCQLRRIAVGRRDVEAADALALERRRGVIGGAVDGGLAAGGGVTVTSSW